MQQGAQGAARALLVGGIDVSPTAQRPCRDCAQCKCTLKVVLTQEEPCLGKQQWATCAALQ